MDLPCSLLSLHVKRQVPAALLRNAYYLGLGETEEWKKAAWDTCSLYVCSFCGSLNPDFFCSFSSFPAASACHPHTRASSLSHCLGGPEKNPQGTHQQGFLISCRSMAGFSHILLYSALEQPSSRAELQHPARQCWLSQAISGLF